VLISLACALVFFAYKEISAAPARQARAMAHIALTIAADDTSSRGATDGELREHVRAHIEAAGRKTQRAIAGAQVRFYSEHPDFRDLGEGENPALARELAQIQAGAEESSGEPVLVDGVSMHRAVAPFRAPDACSDCAARGVASYREGDIVGIREVFVPVGDEFVRTIRQLLYAAAVLATALMCVLGIIFPVLKRHHEEKVRLKYRTESLEREALSDSLTGLANRRFFENALDNYLREFAAIGVPVSLLLFDVDRFKAINDTHGHDAGDRVLKEIAARLKQNARDYDVVARIGGDEFAVITPYLDNKNMTAVADRYRASVGRMRIANGASELVATVSVGVSIGIGEEATKGDMFRAADEKLYEAKRTGRNRVAA
jgi:diguanylate cyclase (GGDEF)-like protein